MSDNTITPEPPWFSHTAPPAPGPASSVLMEYYEREGLDFPVLVVYSAGTRPTLVKPPEKSIREHMSDFLDCRRGTQAGDLANKLMIWTIALAFVYFGGLIAIAYLNGAWK
jgi:hypothetical protein